MTADIIQFVSSLSASPTVLLDLNDENLWAATLFAPTPAALQRAPGGSMMEDGQPDVATSWANRFVTINLELITPSQDVKAAEVQKLARMLARPRLLRYQPVGATHPVFFELYRGDIAGLSTIDVTAAAVDLALTIPAKPHAYGLPVIGSASVTVSNDPTAASNPMSFVIDDVRGDDHTPLRLVLEGSMNFNSLLVGATAGAEAPAPFHSALGETPSGVDPGWTKTNPSDSTAIGGSYRRIVRNSSVGGSSTEFPTITAGWADVPFGEYRILARMRSNVATARVQVQGDPQWRTVGADWRWIDLGTWRQPSFSPLTSPFLDDEARGAGGVTLIVSGPIVTDSRLDVDHVMAVPIPGPDDNDGSSTPLWSTESNSTLTVDGISDVVYYRDAGDAPTVGTWMADGGMPHVTPGLTNRVYVVGWRGESLDIDDPASTITVTWSYVPRYVYLRPVGS